MKTPTLEEFVNHAKNTLSALGEDYSQYDRDVKLKFMAWSDNDWHTLGKSPRKIKNWRSTLTNSIKYFTPAKAMSINVKTSAMDILRQKHNLV